MESNVTMLTVVACHKWLLDFSFDNNTNLEDVNDAFMTRNIGGIVLIGILTTFGILGNSLVLWIYLMRFRQSNYRTYIIWLSSLDMVNCIGVMPFYFIYLCFPLIMESKYACKIGRSGSYVITLSSALLLIVIAGDRYRKICTPNKKQLSGKQATKCCFIGLIMSVLLSWPTFVMFGKNAVEVGLNDLRGYRCLVADEYADSTYMKVFQVIMSTIALTVTITLTLMYSLIVKGLYRHRKYFINAQGSIKSREACPIPAEMLDRSTRKSTMTLLAVTLCFILSFLPHHVLAIAFFMNKTFECSLGFSGGAAYYTFVWMVFFNTAADPVIYGFSDKRFRYELKRMCKGIRRGQWSFKARRSERSMRSQRSPKSPHSAKSILGKRVHFSFE
ncbi:orexin receptor type 2-like [Mizuhopecten yessoensis]|uniref:Orexin receptor type 2 n=1 Tax=Mizuhopecten yessoensis TaxID=6573 RepID=A0A210QV12_MIZYE|nr:orexin receptor type 2-like [Mizuhopecten yessoensis]OWF52588.1 Orexin receptor type 2 [Mizuhopecten yessoensis]